MDSQNSTKVFQSFHICSQVGANSPASNPVKSWAQTSRMMACANSYVSSPIKSCAQTTSRVMTSWGSPIES